MCAEGKGRVGERQKEEGKEKGYGEVERERGRGREKGYIYD